MALAFLVFSSERVRCLADRPALRFLLVCGRHSLEVFSLGTVLAMLFRLIFCTFGVTVTTQLAANGIGLGLMIALGVMLENARKKVAPRVAALKSVAQAPTL
jgi:hypothetical protein